MAVDLSKISPNLMYSVTEAARILGITEQTIRLYLKEKTLKGIKSKKGRWKISGEELRRFVQG